MSGVERIAAERRRQIEVEGWTPEHDDGHRCGELAMNAATLVLCVIDDGQETIDPWGLVEKHAANRLRQLEIAGALIAAEIDRLERMGERG